VIPAELPESSLAGDVTGGDRRALARAITLVESTRADHRVEAAELLDALLRHTGRAIRLGISGAPGVGKSTFIARFGTHIAEEGHKVAVLAVDPTSRRSGGSILGDKTRMDELARHPNAFIRPSPSGGALGGVARRTREAMLVCEAAGFDVVLVETVGVGQSEIEVDDMVDLFILLVSPGGGDELQGIKRGVTEVADIVVVTKADGDLLGAAQQVAADYGHALHLLRAKHQSTTATVLRCSALRGEGIGEVWDTVRAQRQALESSGELGTRRGHQAVRWLWAEVTDTLLNELRNDPEVRNQVAEVEAAVARNAVSPVSGARTLLSARGGDAQE
jgi:LAO/AO transport system kinase